MRITALCSISSVLIGRVAFVSSFAPLQWGHHRSITSSPSTSSTCIQATPEPLGSEGDWSAYLDAETTGLVYYFNTRTGESRWEPPTSTFPQVYLTPRSRRRAQRVREEYVKAQKMQKQTVPAEEKKVSILSTILDKGNDVRVVETRQEPNWFAGLFEETKLLEEAKQAKEDQALAPVIVEKKKAEEPNWFASLFDSPKKDEEPNWFANLFDSSKKEDEPNWFENLVVTPKKEEEPNWFASLFDTPKKSNEEPNWFASIFDATQITEQTVESPVPTVVDVDKPEKGEEAPPSWVKDRWPGGLVAQQPAPVTEEPKPVPVDRDEKPKGKALLKSIFGGRNKDDGEPSGNGAVNGAVGATIEPPEVAEDKKKRSKGKEAVPVKERPVKDEPRVEVKTTPKVDVAPRTKVVTTTKVPELIVPAKEVPIKIEMSAYVLPHPYKILWGGEDAVFTQGRTFGVFDGVSGANKTDGVALYSKTLANQMKKVVGDGGLSTRELQNTMSTAVKIADARATGATTALVASIDEYGYLNALNVGDSTCIVIRDDRVVAATKEKVHFFECPFQLGKDLPDRPKDGTKLKARLRRGDIIVMASDGVFDNISEREVVKVVKAAPPRSSIIAKRIVDLSRRVSLDPNAVTPFAILSKRSGDKDYQSGTGGKLDDISCIVVRYT